MFQNITENSEKQQEESTKNIKEKIKKILVENFGFKNIILIFLTMIISSLSIGDDVKPFGLAMIAASVSAEIPVIGILIGAIIGTAIGNGLKSLLNLVLSTIIYFSLIIIKRPKVAIEERNELLKTGGRIFWANFIVTFFQNISGTVLLYDIFIAFISAGLTYAFYKIFVNGISPIKNWGEKVAFSVEELVSTCIVIALAAIVFDSITIFDLHISNIIIIFLIMVLGWKNGLLIGGTAGLCIGLTLSMTQLEDIMQIAVFAVCGIVAGILNKIGKIGVVIGFILGNCIIIYLSNGQTAGTLYFREIFVSALFLLFVPKNFKINIDELYSKERLLTDVGENRLNSNNDITDKINNISNIISEIEIEEKNIPNEMNEMYKDVLVQNLELIQNNIFYDDVINEENNIMNECFDVIQKNDIILENDFIEILKKHNNYIIMQDEKIKNDLREMIKILNKSYKMLQIEIVKIQEKNKNSMFLKNEFKNISNAIKNVINGTEKDNKKFNELDQFDLQIGCCKSTKDGSDVSGDCSLQTRLKNGKYLFAISDGMGSGKEARKSSKYAIDTLEKILNDGLEDEDAINYLNDTLKIKSENDMYSTIDFSIVDLNAGIIEIVKSGACNTYIKNKRKINIIKSEAIPMGIADNIHFKKDKINISDGDILIMCSDGVLNCRNGFDENWIEDFLKNLTTSSVQKIADLLLEETIDNNFGKVKDDTTIIVAKFIQK